MKKPRLWNQIKAVEPFDLTKKFTINQFFPEKRKQKADDIIYLLKNSILKALPDSDTKYFSVSKVQLYEMDLYRFYLRVDVVGLFVLNKPSHRTVCQLVGCVDFGELPFGIDDLEWLK